MLNDTSTQTLLISRLCLVKAACDSASELDPYELVCNRPLLSNHLRPSMEALRSAYFRVLPNPLHIT